MPNNYMSLLLFERKQQIQNFLIEQFYIYKVL